MLEGVNRVLVCFEGVEITVFQYQRLISLINSLNPQHAEVYIAGHLPAFAELSELYDSVHLLTAPCWLLPYLDSRNPRCIHEVLVRRGWLSRDGLVNLVDAWRSLNVLIQPDLILIDEADTAALSFYGLDNVFLVDPEAKLIQLDTVAPALQPMVDTLAERLMDVMGGVGDNEGHRPQSLYQLYSSFRSLTSNRLVKFNGKSLNADKRDNLSGKILVFLDPHHPDFNYLYTLFFHYKEVVFCLDCPPNQAEAILVKHENLQKRLMIAETPVSFVVGNGGREQLNFVAALGLPSLHLPFRFDHLLFLNEPEFKRQAPEVSVLNQISRRKIRTVLERRVYECGENIRWVFPHQLIAGKYW